MRLDARIRRGALLALPERNLLSFLSDSTEVGVFDACEDEFPKSKSSNDADEDVLVGKGEVLVRSALTSRVGGLHGDGSEDGQADG